MYLPKFDRETREFVIDPKTNEVQATCMSQFNAARKLLMDADLVDKLDHDIQSLLSVGGHDPVQVLTQDEV